MHVKINLVEFGSCIVFGSYNSHKLFSKYMNVLAVKEGYHCHFTVILKFKILRNSIESQDNDFIHHNNYKIIFFAGNQFMSETR